MLSQSVYLSRVVAGANFSEKIAPGRVAPIAAHLLLTENCQAKCITCDYWKSTWANAISTDIAVETINRLAQVGVRYLRFTGGEPLLRRDLFQILEDAHSHKLKRIRLQTNGLLLKKRAENINASPITHVTISLDAMGEENDRLRGVSGYYGTAIEGASKLEGKCISIACTLTGPGAGHLVSLIDESKRRGWSFSYNLLNNSIFKFSNANLDCWPNDHELQEILQVLNRHLDRPKYELDYVRRHYQEGPSRRFDDGEPPCVLGYIYIYVTSNGDILTGCYSLSRLGNILEDDIREIVRSQAYRERCRSMMRRECDGCTCSISYSLDSQNTFGWLAHRIVT